MNTQEAKKIFAVITCTYPNWQIPNIDMAANIWASALAAYSYSDVGTALKAYIMGNTSGFAPTPAQLIEYMQTSRRMAELPETKAWELVTKAISKGSYKAKEAYDELPDAVKEAVGSPTQIYKWAVDENFNESVVSSNFMRSYKTVIDRKYALEKLPAEYRDALRISRSEQDRLEDEHG